MIINVGLTFLRASLYVICSNLATKKLFEKLNLHIIYAKMKFYDDNPPGRIISRVGKDIANTDDYLPWVNLIIFS